ncbi:hypothetical protein SAMN05216229_11228 [Geopseudomonas sagittaria]|jgi:hypothetical protein|uniref:Uncharacterized protein n=1 Tax=Geopseudomonas sagittaria TaxID=1135990 RepID=A0A1I5W0J8_9GAMM|nr:hypothetical protein [Pseudomonas sagittaria]SFQ13245.1 hypothetical protein SAMN05216229_11228 [Pseudomonas sagittaria]
MSQNKITYTPEGLVMVGAAYLLKTGYCIDICMAGHLVNSNLIARTTDKDLDEIIQRHAGIEQQLNHT